MKKILALFLVQILCITFFSFQAAAQETQQYPKFTDNANSWRYINGEVISEQYSISLIAEESYHPDATLTGIDVSKHQGVIDWEKVKAAGIDFAIIRCGFAEDKPEYDDTRWEYNASECERLGIPYGVYLYSYAFNEAEAESEADHVLRLIEGHSPSLPIYYDMEDNSTLQYDHVAMANAFCRKISDAGYPVGIYASKYWWETYLADESLDRWHRWVAQWNTSCTYTGEYAVWQYSSTGRVDGISTNVDMNFLIGYPEDHGVAPGPQLSGAVTDGNMPELSWNTLSGASGYKVYRSTQRNSGYTAFDASAAFFTDTTAQPGITYYYKVKAVYPNGSQSGSSNIVEISFGLDTPVLALSSDVDSGKPKLKWNAVGRADGYEVYRKTGSDGKYTLCAATTTAYYTDTSATAGSKYYYKVRAINGGDAGAKSAFSEVQNIVCDLPRVNVRISRVPETDNIKLSWPTVEKATGYKVYRSSEWGGEYRLIETTTKNTYTDTLATGDDGYYYKVFVTHSDKNADSAGSEPVSSFYSHPKVAFRTFTASATGKAQFAWNGSDGATGYEVYCSQSRYGQYKLIAVTKGTSYINRSAQDGKTYYYRIKAIYSPKVRHTAFFAQ